MHVGVRTDSIHKRKLNPSPTFFFLIEAGLSNYVGKNY